MQTGAVKQRLNAIYRACLEALDAIQAFQHIAERASEDLDYDADGKLEAIATRNGEILVRYCNAWRDPKNEDLAVAFRQARLALTVERGQPPAVKMGLAGIITDGKLEPSVFAGQSPLFGITASCWHGYVAELSEKLAVGLAFGSGVVDIATRTFQTANRLPLRLDYSVMTAAVETEHAAAVDVIRNQPVNEQQTPLTLAIKAAQAVDGLLRAVGEYLNNEQPVKWNGKTYHEPVSFQVALDLLAAHRPILEAFRDIDLSDTIGDAFSEVWHSDELRFRKCGDESSLSYHRHLQFIVAELLARFDVDDPLAELRILNRSIDWLEFDAGHFAEWLRAERKYVAPRNAGMIPTAAMQPLQTGNASFDDATTKLPQMKMSEAGALLGGMRFAVGEDYSKTQEELVQVLWPELALNCSLNPELGEKYWQAHGRLRKWTGIGLPGCRNDWFRLAEWAGLQPPDDLTEQWLQTRLITRLETLWRQRKPSDRASTSGPAAASTQDAVSDVTDNGADRIVDPENEADNGSGQSNESGKSTGHTWDGPALECSRAYKKAFEKAKRLNEKPPFLNRFVESWYENYGSELPYVADTLLKKLQKHRASEWDPDGKYNARSNKQTKSG